MIKKELIAKVAKELSMTEKDVEKVVEQTLAVISNELSRKESVILKNFGSFSIKGRKARMGINPLTREKISIPAKEVVVFKPASKIMYYTMLL